LRAASRELGLSEPDARRAVRVAGLSEEAKAAARETGLDDNRTALLAAAKAATPEEQASALRGPAGCRSKAELNQLGLPKYKARFDDR
jgi:hypothetical protein